MEHTKHLWRAFLLIGLFALCFGVGTRFLVPATFGDEGFYRAASRADFMEQPSVHGADRKACAGCHEQQQATHDQGKHAGVNCEVCHAPLSRHARDGKKIADMPTDPTRRLCEYCHRPLRARPRDFPQVDAAEHLVKLEAIQVGDPVPDAACKLCHPAHDPAQK